MTVTCARPECDRTWPRDPVLEIACPTCLAPVGQRCKRPSGHRVWGGEPHPERDIAADQAGLYGPCPVGCCGLKRKHEAMKRKPHPLDAGRDADLAIIKKIAARGVNVYAQHEVRVDELTFIMDLTACHFTGCKLRLEDLLAADDFNLMHDLGGINKHLDRETCQLTDGFTPRFHARLAKPGFTVAATLEDSP